MPTRASMFAALALATTAAAQPYDLLIRGGKVVDGTGNPWRMADIAVRDGRIAAIGELRGATAARTIDAKGLIVAPGFIDIHNHSDNSVLTDGNAESMIRQGVTSMIFGEGGSAAPSPEFADFAAYFAELRKRGISPNIGSYIGSSQIWTRVHGEKAGPPTPDELIQMQAIVRTAMQQGALGVASSLSGPPGAWIDTATLIAMCKVAAEHGGIYSTHMRTEGQGVFESVAEALEIGRKAGIPVDIIHLKLADHKLWGRMPELISTIRNARASGQQVEAHVYPYRAGQNNLSSIIPPWAHEGGSQAMLARLRDPGLRARLRDEIRNGIKGTNWYNHYTATGSWEGMLLVSLSNPEYKRFQGKRMNEVIAGLGGGDDIDVLFKVLIDNNGSVPTIYFHHSEEDMRYALQQPFVSIGSDGTAVRTEGPLAASHPHPRYYGTFPRVLGRYVRDEKVLSLEEAVRKMTSANAARIGIYDRGLLRPGMWADITVFNPDTVIDNSTWEKPHQYATGIEHVIVNGQSVLAKGQHTNARPGQILRGTGFAAAATQTAASSDDRSTAEWVIRNGGSVRIAGRPTPVATLADLPGTAFRITAVDLVGTTIDPKELTRLSGATEITELLLPGTIFNPGAGSTLDANDALAALAPLTKLEKLHFSLHFLTNINVQDKGLAHLKALTGIRDIRLTQSRIKGASLAPFVNLRRLDLNYSSINDDGLQSLAGMKHLTHLGLRDTLITDSGLRHVAGLTELESLDLYGASLTDAGVQHLAKLKHLRKLNLLGATITDEGAAILAGLPSLEELNLYRSRITNDGLTRLRALKNLRSLDVRYARVTRGGVEDFRRAVPACQVEFQDTAQPATNAKLRLSAPSAPTEQAVAQWVTLLGGKPTIRDGAVRVVDLSRTPVSDAQIAHLAALKSLEELNLESTETGDSAAAALAKLTGLRRLNLRHTTISDKGVRALGPALTVLETLILDHTLVQGTGFGNLSPSLTHLSAAGCELSDAVPASLAGHAIRSLNLSYTDLSDAGFAKLNAIASLEDLDFTATEIGDNALKALVMLPRLKHLRISYGRYTDKGLETLRTAPALVTLEVARSRLTDAAIPHLAAIATLRYLNLDYTGITDKGLATLAEALPGLETLRLDNGNITDASVPVLSKLTSLRELNLYHTRVSQAAHDRLKAALPKTRIVWERDSAISN
ncbi:MAG: amidohydrolase family protein [Bryobacteraceae bacterium]|nr:amidohydrolase family protein [Bryobacteraceae bacterium]